jgi:hypothetical protein
MPRQAERFDDHDVESQGKGSELRPHGEKRLEGAGDAAALSRLQRCSAGREIGTRLDLDRREHTSPLRHDVDFSGWATPIYGEYAPAAQPQMPAA